MKRKELGDDPFREQLAGEKLRDALRNTPWSCLLQR